MLIVLEGIDGTGKNTQCKRLKAALAKRGFEVKHIHYPDYDRAYGKMIRSYLDGQIELTVRELFLLYLADMVKDEQTVKENLKDGKVVMMDRYFFSTVAYQSASGFNYDNAKKVQEVFALPKPDIVFYLSMPVAVSMARKKKQRLLDENRKGDRHESSKKLQEATEKFYNRMIADNFGAKKWVVIDGSGSPEETHREMIRTVDALLLKKQG